MTLPAGSYSGARIPYCRCDFRLLSERRKRNRASPGARLFPNLPTHRRNSITRAYEFKSFNYSPCAETGYCAAQNSAGSVRGLHRIAPLAREQTAVGEVLRAATETPTQPRERLRGGLCRCPCPDSPGKPFRRLWRRLSGPWRPLTCTRPMVQVQPRREPVVRLFHVHRVYGRHPPATG